MLDKKSFHLLFIMCSLFIVGCDGRAASVLMEIPIRIIGAIIFNPSVSNYSIYAPEYTVDIQIDDSKCDVTNVEYLKIKNSIVEIKIGMSRKEILQKLGLDVLENRIAVKKIWSDMKKTRYIYYLGNKSGLELEFNELSGTLNVMPKLIGQFWKSVN